jgi:hypothetical protein
VIRTHVSIEETIPVLIEKDQNARDDSQAMGKPRGLWYEVDGDWRRWARREMPHWLSGRFLHRLEIDPKVKLLEIRTEKALREFDREYPAPLGPWDRRESSRFSTAVDWPAVAEAYDGIEIAPYVWPARLELLWYYGWDCASGCLWRPRESRLVKIRRLPGEVKAD